MSLDYNLTAIKDRDTSDEGWAKTQAVIFATMAVGIGEITEDTAPEFFARISLFENMNGSLWRAGDGSDAPITIDDVRAHIGLKTNVFPQESRSKWIKRVMTGALADREREYRLATEAVATT